MRISVLSPTIRGIEGLYRPAFGLMKQTFRDFEWLYEIHDPKDPPDFNACMNRLIKKSKGDIIVFLQDYILPSEFGLKLFLQAIEKRPNTFFTGPVGKTLNDDDIDWEWRKFRQTDDGLDFTEWEIDWAAAPREALFKIGGFDEELDKFWGFDNVNIALRAQAVGYEFRNLPENKAVALDHNKLMDHPYMGLRNPDHHNGRLGQIIRGEVTVKYL